MGFMRRQLLVIGLLLSFILLGSTVLTAQASSPNQNFVTPTPGADGRIVITVQEGQNCSLISTLAGIPISQLRSLNRLDEACTLRIGQELLIGIGGPAGGTPTPTSGPIPTATPTSSIAPTPIPGEAIVCVLLYEDINGDAMRQDTEVTIPNGAVSVTGTSAQYSKTANTIAGIDPICFDKVVQGTYNISVAAPEGYNPTTQLNYTLDIKIGEQIYVDFGAQKGGKSSTVEPTATDTGSSNLLGIAGAVLVLSALGLGVYAWMAYGRKPGYELRKPPHS
jgi:hypothetical protein